MDFVTCLNNLTLAYEYLCLFLLLVFGLRKLYFNWFPWNLVKFVFDLRLGGKSGGINHGFSLKNVFDGSRLLVRFLKSDSIMPLIDENEKEMDAKSTHFPGSDDEFDSENDEDGEEGDGFTSEIDDSNLRELIKIERHRVNAARAELEKERDASATAAEEAMAMILRLQGEKSSIELESNQYRRLAMEKQMHDQEVIHSLQWLVWSHESERDVLEQQLKSCRRKLNRYLKIDDEIKDECENEDDGVLSCFNGDRVGDEIENVFYSSLGSNLSPQKVLV